jgi:hypothetical protein
MSPPLRLAVNEALPFVSLASPTSRLAGLLFAGGTTTKDESNLGDRD